MLAGRQSKLNKVNTNLQSFFILLWTENLKSEILFNLINIVTHEKYTRTQTKKTFSLYNDKK